MTNTKQAKWKGYVALVVGCLLAIPMMWSWILLAEDALRGTFPTLWNVVPQLWRVVVVGYFGMIAYKHLGPLVTSDARWQRAGWGRILLGVMMMFSGVQQRFYPRAPSRYDFTPSNDTEAASMEFTGKVLIPGAGALVLVWGLSLVFRRSREVRNASE